MGTSIAIKPLTRARRFASNCDWRERLLMAKQHLAVTHGNHVIMKNALVDNVRVLLGENHLLGIHLIQLATASLASRVCRAG